MEPHVLDIQDLGDGLMAYRWVDENGEQWIDYIDTTDPEAGLMMEGWD